MENTNKTKGNRIENGEDDNQSSIFREDVQKLVSQLKYRLYEGQGEAIYELGVADDGTLTGLSENELKDSILQLERMCKELYAECSLVCRRKGSDGYVAQMLVRKLRKPSSSHHV